MDLHLSQLCIGQSSDPAFDQDITVTYALVHFLVTLAWFRFDGGMVS